MHGPAEACEIWGFVEWLRGSLGKVQIFRAVSEPGCVHFSIGLGGWTIEGHWHGDLPVRPRTGQGLAERPGFGIGVFSFSEDVYELTDHPGRRLRGGAG